MGDDFLRLLLCRHIFASCVLRAHRSFRGRGAPFQPSSRPPLPDLDLIENPTLQRYALDLAAQLDVRHLFVDSCGEVDWWRPQVGVGCAASSYPIVQNSSDAQGRGGHAIAGGMTSSWNHIDAQVKSIAGGMTTVESSRWNQPRLTQFHHPNSYNTMIPAPTADLYMGSAGISNVMGRRRHYSGTGVVSLGPGGGSTIGGMGMGGRLGYGNNYSSSINALNHLSSSYPAPQYMNNSRMIQQRHPFTPIVPSQQHQEMLNVPSQHHSSSYSSLPLMTGSPTGGGHLLSHGNSILGNYGPTSLYRRYPASSTFMNNTDIGWRRWLKAPIIFKFEICSLSWPKIWTNCVLMIAINWSN